MGSGKMNPLPIFVSSSYTFASNLTSSYKLQALNFPHMAHAFTQANFDAEVLKSSVPVLVDFWAPWCGPCKLIGPIVDEIAAELDGKGVKVGKVNVDENGMLAQTYGVMSIPTLMVFKGGQPVGQTVGSQTKEKLLEMIKKAM